MKVARKSLKWFPHILLSAHSQSPMQILSFLLLNIVLRFHEIFVSCPFSFQNSTKDIPVVFGCPVFLGYSWLWWFQKFLRLFKGAFSAVLRDHLWQYLGTVYGSGDQICVSCKQSLSITHSTINLWFTKVSIIQLFQTFSVTTPILTSKSALLSDTNSLCIFLI